MLRTRKFLGEKRSRNVVQMRSKTDPFTGIGRMGTLKIKGKRDQWRRGAANQTDRTALRA